MEIKRAGSQLSAKGSSRWFTGTVRVDPLFEAPDPARVSGASVTFEPGARTACVQYEITHRRWPS
jgi:quercetin dioxygenase-like cupin family protein